jgi:hydrogenase maturation protease
MTSEHETTRRVLVIGYGNPGRRDDGLGPALAEAIDRKRLPDVTVDSDYQLTVEDAADVAGYDVVLFADADTACREPFELRRISVDPDDARIRFTSHSCSPEGVLALAEQLFQSRADGYVLGIRGYTFNEFGQGLSDRAAENLDRAIECVEEALRSGRFEPTGPADG